MLRFLRDSIWQEWAHPQPIDLSGTNRHGQFRLRSKHRELLDRLRFGRRKRFFAIGWTESKEWRGISSLWLLFRLCRKNRQWMSLVQEATSECRNSTTCWNLCHTVLLTRMTIPFRSSVPGRVTAMIIPAIKTVRNWQCKAAMPRGRNPNMETNAAS
jgi:hypothetical protein